MTERSGKGAASPRRRLSGPRVVTNSQTRPLEPVRDSGRATGRGWCLWFPARPTLPPAMRGRTKSGRIKPSQPTLPLNVNDRTRVHWRTVGRLVAYWRGEAKRLAEQAGIPPCQRIRVSGVIFHTRNGRFDERGDDERLKSLIDGLVDAKVIPDDTRGHIEHGPTESKVDAWAPGVLLIVDELEHAAPERGAEGLCQTT